MGNFLFNSGIQPINKTDSKQQARINFVSFIKKRVRLNQLPQLYEDFYKTYYPEFMLDRIQFDDVFSALLNVTD
jgi:hypothetical protein